MAGRAVRCSEQSSSAGASPGSKRRLRAARLVTDIGANESRRNPSNRDGNYSRRSGTRALFRLPSHDRPGQHHRNGARTGTKAPRGLRRTRAGKTPYGTRGGIGSLRECFNFLASRRPQTRGELYPKLSPVRKVPPTGAAIALADRSAAKLIEDFLLSRMEKVQAGVVDIAVLAGRREKLNAGRGERLDRRSRSHYLATSSRGGQSIDALAKIARRCADRCCLI